MPRNYFTEEEMDILIKSQWVKSISKANVVFTKEFKQEYSALLNRGIGPVKALVYLGIDHKILGANRITKLAARVRKQSKRPEGFERKENSSKGKKRKLNFVSKEEELEYYKNYSEILRQENELLKKVEALERSYQAKNSRAKNSK